MNVHVTVIESPVASDTSVNVCLASIPEQLTSKILAHTVVLLNRPDSPMRCVVPPVPVFVKVLANTIFVAVSPVPLCQVMLVATPLSKPSLQLLQVLV